MAQSHTADDRRTDDLDLRLLALDVDDDEARELANRVYTVLRDAGYDVEGVAPVLSETEGDR